MRRDEGESEMRKGDPMEPWQRDNALPLHCPAGCGRGGGECRVRCPAFENEKASKLKTEWGRRSVGVAVRSGAWRWCDKGAATRLRGAIYLPRRRHEDEKAKAKKVNANATASREREPHEDADAKPMASAVALTLVVVGSIASITSFRQTGYFY
ncbi:hypothetical protein V9T40_010620 [Parthenolecanium corni]|uniref:Uncharacterized protein n=1 Tax=Parthenolecanium corni TaxID=536013 RepID=A0AAN9T7G3_9HEMI